MVERVWGMWGVWGVWGDEELKKDLAMALVMEHFFIPNPSGFDITEVQLFFYSLLPTPYTNFIKYCYSGFLCWSEFRD
ncbi:hypothetical protein [Okeania sp. KiyG1]|uniref:hypothetical protein n=1 Tax=Okeania sp. KiyG1 TaxID=2720165 RepID=UPI001923CE18|nr:hypothetical protein [Okeania sp. KiyG1]GFZ99501.1 hypothetical protein CYANOKiyG1_11010 [Okeania sp. KiyG1]